MTREQAIDEATKVWLRADITTGGSIIQILEKLGLVRFEASRKDFLTVPAELSLPATSYTLPNLQTDSDGRVHRRGQAPTRWSSTQGRPLGLREHRAPGPCAPRQLPRVCQTPRRHPRSREDDFEAAPGGTPRSRAPPTRGGPTPPDLGEDDFKTPPDQGGWKDARKSRRPGDGCSSGFCRSGRALMLLADQVLEFRGQT